MTTPLPPANKNSAFFFDFDGTLVEIAPRPELVQIDPQVRDLLCALRDQFEGAVAVITGRPLDVVDDFLAPLVLPTAGEHGSIRRDAEGQVHANESGVEAVDTAERVLKPFVESQEGLMLERKKVSVALHYRLRPDLAEACRVAAENVVTNNPGLVLLPGKMVFELKPKGIDKGTAVRSFLEEAPFRGRSPIFVGDDVTDEYAFAVVNAMGGTTIKIDDGETQAKYRTDRSGLFDWLSGLVQKP